jgi:hypothetical protein
MTLMTNAHACDRSSFTARLLVYDKACKKLPAEYLAAYNRTDAPIEEVLAQAQDEYKSDPKFCQNYAKTVATSVAYYKQHRRVTSC